MSIRTWKAEFYPTPANSCTDELTALFHSLRKWKGALPENTRKHGVYFRDAGIRAHPEDDKSDDVRFTDATCSMCSWVDDDCAICPLSRANDDHACDDSRQGPDGEYLLSIYCASWDNPQPMIDLIEKAIKQVENETGWRLTDKGVVV